MCLDYGWYFSQAGPPQYRHPILTSTLTTPHLSPSSRLTLDSILPSRYLDNSNLLDMSINTGAMSQQQPISGPSQWRNQNVQDSNPATINPALLSVPYDQEYFATTSAEWQQETSSQVLSPNTYLGNIAPSENLQSNFDIIQAGTSAQYQSQLPMAALQREVPANISEYQPTMAALQQEAPATMYATNGLQSKHGFYASSPHGLSHVNTAAAVHAQARGAPQRLGTAFNPSQGGNDQRMRMRPVQQQPQDPQLLHENWYV